GERPVRVRGGARRRRRRACVERRAAVVAKRRRLDVAVVVGGHRVERVRAVAGGRGVREGRRVRRRIGGDQRVRGLARSLRVEVDVRQAGAAVVGRGVGNIESRRGRIRRRIGGGDRWYEVAKRLCLRGRERQD